MWNFLWYAFVFVVFPIVLRCIVALRRIFLRKSLSNNPPGPSAPIVAFFHPYCTTNGGGERVLWTAINAMCKRSSFSHIIVYTNDHNCFINRQMVLDSVTRTFGLRWSTSETPSRVRFVRMWSQPLLSPDLYPIFTLLGQAIGSMVAALEVIFRCPPDVFIDTTGFAFTLPLARWVAGAKTAAYVHYPTLSSDMLDRVCGRARSHVQSKIIPLSYNNASWIRNSHFISWVKSWYYQFLLFVYGLAGCSLNVDLVMTNSTWTANHINSLWGGRPFILYPPCPTEDLASSSMEEVVRSPWIMSVGQFRPEKNHELQLQAFRCFLDRTGLIGEAEKHNFRLLVVGGCRSSEDLARVSQLRKRVHSLGLDGTVSFHVNLPYIELKEYVHKCTINLHTMVDEHFGIGIVEGMASGLITVAHNSGGPLTDIIGPRSIQLADPCSLSQDSKGSSTGVGFLASTADEYADVFEFILLHSSEQQKASIQVAALERVQDMFSETNFVDGWLRYMPCLGL